MLFDFLLNTQDHARRSPARTRSRSSTRCARPPALPDCHMGHVPAQRRQARLSRLTGRRAAGGCSPHRPEQDMRLYRPGIRRRLAPMLRRRPAPYSGWPTSLQVHLARTPVIRYGEEIGMGDDLSLPDRDRFARRCSGHRCLTAASPPPQPTGWSSRWSMTARSAIEKVNVRAQRNDPRLTAVLVRTDDAHAARVPEINAGTCTHVDVPTPACLLCTAPTTRPAPCLPAQPRDQDATVDVSSLGDIAESRHQDARRPRYGDIELG